MRKKLLALLMCATMVLGTSVTAMAATSVDDAKKVYGDNADNFMAEYWKADEAITSVTANKYGSVTYGYANVKKGDVYGTFTPVVVYKNSKSATGYTQATPLKAEIDEDKIGYETVKTAANSEKIVAIAPQLLGSTVYTGLKNGKGDPDKAVVVKADTDADDSVGKYYDAKGNLIFDTNAGSGSTPTGVTSTEAAAVALAKKIDTDVNSGTAGTLEDGENYAVYVVSAAGAKNLHLVSTTEVNSSDVTTVTKTDKVDGTMLYVKTPYGSKDNLVVAKKNGIIKATDENTFGTIWSTVRKSNVYENNITDLQAAIDSKTFTKDAVAVQVTAYVQAPIATDDSLALESTGVDLRGYAKTLFDSTKIQGGQFTFDSDLISRTAFKDAAAVDVFTLGLGKVLDENYGLVTPFNKVATVAVDKTITFDKDATFGDGVFVFDKGELAAEPATDANDGVADTTPTTPAADTAASPKTGDVAPIAALAVVMMGAFGAMVVASKKRA